ncbi:hypothetical protein B1B_00759, partial [mine drainage metagenome]
GEVCSAAREIDLALTHRTVERLCRAEGHPPACPHWGPDPAVRRPAEPALGEDMWNLDFILNPPSGLTIPTILALGFILGIMHGATPDEHTWPITFSYSVGSYSSRGGMRAGFVFSAGFTLQRSILTALGFLGLAGVYMVYNLDGPTYIVVGFVMFVAGWYLLRGSDIHLPLDHWLERLLHPFFRDHSHHSTVAERQPVTEGEVGPVPIRMALLHGFVAGWGFGGFAVIIVFILAPQVPNVGWAALVGTCF